jgi:hypothetical protein
MIELKIFENLPKHADSIIRYPKNPKVVANWLKPFVKKGITLDQITDFIYKRSYFLCINEYKKSLHFLVLTETLGLDLEPWEWFYSSHKFNMKSNKEFIRYFKIWSITKN